MELVNDVLNGPNGDDAVIIITYDEHGGRYDHVAPPAAPKPGDGEPVEHAARNAEPTSAGAQRQGGFGLAFAFVMVSPSRPPQAKREPEWMPWRGLRSAFASGFV